MAWQTSPFCCEHLWSELPQDFKASSRGFLGWQLCGMESFLDVLVTLKQRGWRISARSWCSESHNELQIIGPTGGGLLIEHDRTMEKLRSTTNILKYPQMTSRPAMALEATFHIQAILSKPELYWDSVCITVPITLPIRCCSKMCLQHAISFGQGMPYDLSFMRKQQNRHLKHSLHGPLANHCVPKWPGGLSLRLYRKTSKN